jgi:hypothetical protein
LQEALEDLGQVRHAIWLNCIKEYGDQGMPMPAALAPTEEPGTIPGLDTRGGQVETKNIVPEALEGTFRFKPRGSTENADITKQRADYIQWLQVLPMLIQTWPSMAMQLSGNVEAAKSALEQGLRLFRMPDKQAWLTPPPPVIDPMTGLPMPPGMGMAPPGMGAPPGAPPGMPPQIAQMMGGPKPPQGPNGAS